MDSSYASETDELRYMKQRNAGRPSVIFFHGILNEEVAKEKGGHRHLLAEKDGEMKRYSSWKRCHETSEGKPKKDTSCLQDGPCLDTEEEDECLRKRHRTSFTSFQLKRLEEEFDQDCYIVGMKRWRLSEELEIPEKQIKIWFQNKRTKVKKHCSNCAHTTTRERTRIRFE